MFTLVMATLPHPPRLPGDPSDKVLHVLAFATLGLLAAWAYPRVRVVKLALGLCLFGALIEAIQAIPALNRDSQWLDWVADAVASGAALLSARWRMRGSRLD
jgi:hypothetical protein